MPQAGLIYRILVASPSDCVQERKVIPEVVYSWNAANSLYTGAILEPVLWETHARPQLGDRPQAIINKQLVENCDILVGAFWTRLGTDTGEAESGTAEEIEQFRKAGKPVLLYFSSAPVVPESLGPEQYKALIAYKQRLGKHGLYSQYDSVRDFREQLQRHLSGTMAELHQAQSAAGPATGEPDSIQAVQMYKAQFESFLRRLEAEWSSERDSEPYNIDEGKFILQQALSEVLTFRSQIIGGNPRLPELLNEAAKRLRAIQRHNLYNDGGASFQAFWTEGDDIIKALKEVPAAIDGLLPEDSAK